MSREAASRGKAAKQFCERSEPCLYHGAHPALITPEYCRQCWRDHDTLSLTFSTSSLLHPVANRHPDPSCQSNEFCLRTSIITTAPPAQQVLLANRLTGRTKNQSCLRIGNSASFKSLTLKDQDKITNQKKQGVIHYKSQIPLRRTIPSAD